MNFNLNLKEFIKYALRFKWLLIVIPIVCVVATYFMVKTLPRQYRSEALISTGLTSQFQDAALSAEKNMDYFKLSQQFGNLLEMIKSKKRISLLSYQLIIHDLQNPQNPFKPYSDAMKKLSPDQREQAIREYEQRYQTGALISIADNGKIKLFDLLKSVGYDDKSLSEKLDVYRNGESDFIKVEFTSSNPALSVFVVNTVSTGFIAYYTGLAQTNQRQSLAVLDTIVREKQSELQKKNSALINSSISAASNAAGASSAQQQSDFINQQIAEAESQRVAVIRNISSLQGAMAEVNSKLSGSGGYVTPNSSRDNNEIINIDNQLALANKRWVNNNFRPEDKASLDSLQRIKARLIARGSDQAVGANAAAIRQGLINDKIKLENDLAAAKSTLTVIEQQLAKLGPRRSSGGGGGSVVAENGAQSALARDAEMAAKEYADAQALLEQTNMLTKAGIRLNLAEPGLPQLPEPSKNALYVGLSGVSSFMICLLTLFLIFMLNTAIANPKHLAAATGQRVIGSLNLIDQDNKDLRDIWEDKGSTLSYSVYKDLLRSLRFELLEELSGNNNVLGITSLLDGEGKSFVAGSLSYAFAMMGKNVLLISNDHQSLTGLVTNQGGSKKSKSTAEGAQVFESFLVKKEILIEDRITILNRKNSDSSLLELKDSNSLIAGFSILKDTFDVIIVDIDSAQDLHNVKEWLMFTDKSIAVFAAGNKITEGDMGFVKYLSTQKGFLGWVLNKVKVVSAT
ncbi:hypothetical protein U0035_05785 [Niabella yanshanensis]|uniref:Lipopolysaccharide biosynthesis protein n=1 Tax=Niabella yanshanensis TaxID=577386 RepID=A0ABZ0WBY6_9BACT|nr:lipopolysaccharide biosynthesis protein [Niabella yanshanensis]WQD39656.1 hypothetical protein U0035_05785 [Niabella yanshanensis]